MNKINLLLSACLAGEKVRYDGNHNQIEQLEQLQKDFNIFLVCPEVQGGMATPRIPSEIISINPLKIQNEYGIDTTDFFLSGASIALDICKQHNIQIALFKAKSPSCGNNKIYDGTFTKTLIDGMGVTAAMLEHNNIKVFNETQIKELYEYIKH